jgi:hypothetical protein
MDGPSQICFNLKWTSRTEQNAILYEPAGPEILPSYMDQPVKYISISNGPAGQKNNTIPYGPAGVHIIPSYMNWLDRILYPSYMDQLVKYISISNGPAGVHIIPSYMDQPVKYISISN